MQIESEIISATVTRQRQLPVNLSLVAAQIGAVVRYSYCQDAFTQFQPDGPVIYLSTTVSETRRRFIIAHELAHIMLRSPAAVRLIEKQGQDALLDNEEDLANRIAGVLLVPDNWVDGMKGGCFTPARLKEVASRAGIPIAMLVTRVEQAGHDIALLHWKRGRRSWHVIDRPGTPIFLHGYVELSEHGRRTLDYLSPERESDVVVDCCVNGIQARIKGRGFRWGSRGEQAFQFLAPKRDVSLLS